MAQLFIQGLIARGDLQRCPVVCSGSRIHTSAWLCVNESITLCQ
jgi:hypothetical protein